MENQVEDIKTDNTVAIACLAMSTFVVFALWGFWSYGVYALGFNCSVFLICYLCLLKHFLEKEGFWTNQSKYWSIPILMIALSYSFYEEPFLQVINIFILPIAFAALCLQSQANFGFGFSSLPEIVAKGWFGAIMELFQARLALLPIFKFTKEKSEGKKDILVRVLIGLGISMGLLVFLVVPLLSSADAEFAQRFEYIIEMIVDPLLELFSEQLVIQLVCLPIFAICMLSQLYSWVRREERVVHEVKKSDSLIVGIVLACVLLVYLVFLSIQFERIWIGELPIDFKDTERLVKSGFWQLFTLTCLNIIIFIQTYGRTNDVVQGLLALFSFASILLLISSAHRMGLYVIYYGFSIEKFFACYTVIYCAILFALFIFLLATKAQVNIVRFGAGLCLWMYAFATLFPVERFIVIANHKLARMHGTRLNLNDLSMLSLSIAPLIEAYGEHLDDNGKPLDCSEHDYHPLSEPLLTRLPRHRRVILGSSRWEYWIDNKRRTLENKAWFEHSVSSILAGGSIERLSEIVSCCKWRDKYSKHSCERNERSTNYRR